MISQKFPVKLPSGKCSTWWHHQMKTFSALLAICAGNSWVTVEFPAQKPVTWSFDVLFDLWWGWWFKTPSSPLWCHCNESALVQVMAWCRQATSHYLNQGWLRSMSTYDINRPQWVKTLLNLKVHVVVWLANVNVITAVDFRSVSIITKTYKWVFMKLSGYTIQEIFDKIVCLCECMNAFMFVHGYMIYLFYFFTNLD